MLPTLVALVSITPKETKQIHFTLLFKSKFGGDKIICVQFCDASSAYHGVCLQPVRPPSIGPH